MVSFTQREKDDLPYSTRLSESYSVVSHRWQLVSMGSIVLICNEVAGEQQHGLPQELRKSYIGAISFVGVP